MPPTVGVPVKLLHEAEGHIVTVELANGELYRGLLVDAEDNMNCQLQNVTFTARDDRQSKLEHVFIRGSKIRFFIMPDMLKHAPMFKRFDPKTRDKGPIGLGRGGGAAAAAGRPNDAKRARIGK